MAELFEEYKKYSLLLKKDQMMSNIEAGTDSYLISCKWMQSYLNFILFEQFKREATEDELEVSDDHFTKNHPGPISNEEYLLEQDSENNNLYGTGTIKGFESDFIDRYVDQQKHANQDYVCVNSELWTFLFERYGGQIIKRYYARQGSMTYTNVDAKLKPICIKFLDCGKMQSG